MTDCNPIQLKFNEASQVYGRLLEEQLNKRLDDGIPTDIRLKTKDKTQTNITVDDKEAKRFIDQFHGDQKVTYTLFTRSCLSEDVMRQIQGNETFSNVLAEIAKNEPEFKGMSSVEILTKLGLQYSDVPIIMDIIKNIEKADFGVPLTEKRAAFFAKNLLMAIKLDNLEDIKIAVENLLKGRTIQVSQTAKKIVVSGDVCAQIMTLNALRHYETLLERTFEGKPIPPILKNITEIKQALMDAKVVSVYNSQSVPHDAIASYSGPFNILEYREEISQGLFSKISGNTFADTILHELQHAIQDKHSTVKPMNVLEAEAYLIQGFYAKLRGDQIAPPISEQDKTILANIEAAYKGFEHFLGIDLKNLISEDSKNYYKALSNTVESIFSTCQRGEPYKELDKRISEIAQAYLNTKVTEDLLSLFNKTGREEYQTFVDIYPQMLQLGAKLATNIAIEDNKICLYAELPNGQYRRFERSLTDKNDRGAYSTSQTTKFYILPRDEAAFISETAVLVSAYKENPHLGPGLEQNDYPIITSAAAQIIYSLIWGKLRGHAPSPQEIKDKLIAVLQTKHTYDFWAKNFGGI